MPSNDMACPSSSSCVVVQVVKLEMADAPPDDGGDSCPLCPRPRPPCLHELRRRFDWLERLRLEAKAEERLRSEALLRASQKRVDETAQKKAQLRAKVAAHKSAENGAEEAAQKTAENDSCSIHGNSDNSVHDNDVEDDDDVSTTQDVAVGPDEPHAYNGRNSGKMPPTLNYIYHKGFSKGYLRGATVGHYGVHTGPLVKDGAAFWEAFCGFDGRRQGAPEYNGRTVAKSITNMLEKGKAKGGDHNHKRQGMGKGYSHKGKGGQGMGRGKSKDDGKAKGVQGKGLARAPATRARPTAAEHNDVPLSGRWGERLKSGSSDTD